jgi:hypothetical protein
MSTFVAVGALFVQGQIQNRGLAPGGRFDQPVRASLPLLVQLERVVETMSGRRGHRAFVVANQLPLGRTYTPLL